jgi:hypothetical protein
VAKTQHGVKMPTDWFSWGWRKMAEKMMMPICNKAAPLQAAVQGYST